MQPAINSYGNIRNYKSNPWRRELGVIAVYNISPKTPLRGEPFHVAIKCNTLILIHKSKTY
jgi:hypothetical protein